MKLNDYCDAINVDIEITRYSNQGNRCTASFANCEVKEGSILSSAYGSGASYYEALVDYIKEIKGKQIVFHAGSSTLRREFTVPHELEV